MIHLSISIIMSMIVIVVHSLVPQRKDSKFRPQQSFLMLLAVGLFLLWILMDLVPFNPEGLYLKSTSTLLYLLIVPLYFQFYNLVNSESPSSLIMDLLEQKTKLSQTELISGIEKEQFVVRMMDHLVKSGMVATTDDRYRLTWKGKIVVFFYRMDSKFFNRV